MYFGVQVRQESPPVFGPNLDQIRHPQKRQQKERRRKKKKHKTTRKKNEEEEEEEEKQNTSPNPYYFCLLDFCPF